MAAMSIWLCRSDRRLLLSDFILLQARQYQGFEKQLLTCFKQLLTCFEVRAFTCTSCA